MLDNVTDYIHEYSSILTRGVSGITFSNSKKMESQVIYMVLRAKK
jgi:hypothetical protein